MNNTLESIRGRWIAETAKPPKPTEARAAKFYRSSSRQPPRETPFSRKMAEHTEQFSDVILDGSAKDSVRHVDEIMFLEAQI